MATKKKEIDHSTEKIQQDVQKYKGSQLLKMTKYKSLVARTVIKPNELYSFEEVDKLILNFMKKKG